MGQSVSKEARSTASAADRSESESRRGAFVRVGDFGSGDDGQAKVADAMALTASASRRILHTGNRRSCLSARRRRQHRREITRRQLRLQSGSISGITRGSGSTSSSAGSGNEGHPQCRSAATRPQMLAHTSVADDMAHAGAALFHPEIADMDRAMVLSPTPTGLRLRAPIRYAERTVFSEGATMNREIEACNGNVRIGRRPQDSRRPLISDFHRRQATRSRHCRRRRSALAMRRDFAQARSRTRGVHFYLSGHEHQQSRQGPASTCEHIIQGWWWRKAKALHLSAPATRRWLARCSSKAPALLRGA